MPLPYHLTPGAWAIAALAAIFIGLAKGGLSGVGMIPVLLMAEILPARASTGIVLPLLIVGDFFAVHAFRRHAQWHHIRALLPPALLGVVIGYLLMGRIPDHAFKPLIGWIVLALTGLQTVRMIAGKRDVRWFHTKPFAWGMGLLGGTTTMLANAAGPVLSLFFLAVNLPKYELIGTGAWYFLIVNWVKVPFSAGLGLINSSSLTLSLILAPLVVGSVYMARALVHHIPQRLFEILLLVFAGAVALRLVLT